MNERISETIDALTGSRRLRRLRRTPWMRDMVAESRLTPADLILPIFIIEGEDAEEPIEAMPGISRHTIDRAVELVRQAAAAGIPAIAPFPNVPLEKRDRTGSQIADPDNLICAFTRAVKDAGIACGVITDAALDPFTDHGHDGILRDGVIVNDESVARIVEGALAQAKAGADIIAPSDMMDGRIGAIRQALDEEGYRDVAIMSYTAKYASGFYGPYREAIGTDELLRGDKKTYYIDPANSDDALREAELDIAEGADMLMVKPGMPYLDIVRRFRDHFNMPVFAYQVSGEYSMIESAAANGFIDRERVMMESLLAFRRAGADGILSYHALDAARILGE